MDIPDAHIGRLLLVATSALFVLFSLWVNSYPFIDEGKAFILFLYSLLLENISTLF